MAKVAIPIFRSRVAPVFDYCVRVSVFDIGDGVKERTELYLGTLSPIERVAALMKEGVATLVCGTMSDSLDMLFHASDISVIGGIGGPVEEVLEAFMSNRLDEPQYCMPGIGVEKHTPSHGQREAIPHPGSVEGIVRGADRQPPRGAQLRPGGKGKVRILLVEKDIASRKSAVDIFQKSGCEVDAVSSGREAIRALELVCYDLVFMDVQVLEMDGHEATKAIRDPKSTVRCHDIPVIAITENVREEDRERCAQAGMNDYIAKPLKPKTLRQIITMLTPTAQANSRID